MKSKEFIRKIVTPSGAELLRKDGTHWIFRLPNGQRFLVPVGGSDHTECKSYLERRFRRLLELPDNRKQKEKPGGPA